MALQLRRGTNKERLQITPAEGELIFVTDWELVQITGTSIDDPTDTITFSAAHGLSVGDQVLFQSSTQLGLTQSTVYFVISAGLTTTACRLATSSGGSAIPLTGGTGLTLTFAKTPTNASGAPIGTNVTALWIGDGTTVGGIAGNTQGLDDLTDVVITTAAQGDLLFYDGTNWVNENVIQTGDPNNRPVFQYNNTSNAVNSAIVLRKNYDTGTFVTGNTDGTGIRFEVDSNSQATTEYATLTVSYDNTAPTFAVSTSINDGGSYQTAMTSNTVVTDVYGDLRVRGNNIKNSSDNNTITMASGAGALVTLAGDLKVSGNSIQASDGNVNIEMTSNTLTEITGDLQVTGNNIKKSGGTTVVTFSGTNLTTLAGDLQLNGNTIRSSTGAEAIELSGQNVTINGDLTVSGTTTTINSTTLTVDDKNIELASTASPSDTTADLGGITLKGTTDKTIFWQNSDDRWYFNNGVGSDHIIPYQLTDLEDVTISSPNKGQMFTYDGSNWINTSFLRFDSSTYRPRFINNVSGGSSAVEFLKQYTTSIADPSYVAALFGFEDGSGTFSATKPTYTHRFLSEYDTAGNHVFRIQTDATGNFGIGSTTQKTQLFLDDSTLRIVGNELRLNKDVTGAPTLNAKINVNRGSSSDAYIEWQETNSPVQWYISNRTQVNGDVSVIGNLFTEGGGDLYIDGDTITLNNGNAAANCSIIVDRGASDAIILWDETGAQAGGSGRWKTTTNGSTYYNLPNQNLDTTDSPSFAGVTGGNIRVGVTSDNEIDTSTGGLTLDSDSGTVTVDDNLTVNQVLAVDTDTLYVDVANDRVGINTNAPIADLHVVGDILASDEIVAVGALATNGNAIYFNYDDVGQADSYITVKRQDYADVSIRWDEQTAGAGRWQTTTDGSTYIDIPNQDLDTDAEPSFAGATLGSITVGVSTDLTIATTAGDLTINPAGGDTNISGNLDVTNTIEGNNLVVNNTAGSITMGNQTNGTYRMGIIQVTTLTTTSATDLNNASWATTSYRAVEFLLQATSGTDYQIVKGVVIHDDTNTFINTYSDLKTGASDLFTVSATISGGSLKLQVAGASASSTTYKGSWTAIAV